MTLRTRLTRLEKRPPAPAGPAMTLADWDFIATRRGDPERMARFAKLFAPPARPGDEHPVEAKIRSVALTNIPDEETENADD